MSVSSLQSARAEGISPPTPRRSRLKATWFQNDQIADGLDFGLATDRRTLEQVFRLQHDQYVAQGYMDPHPSNWRLSIHNALPATRVFVARSKDRVVATMTLIADSPVGLPIDEIYSDELRTLRDAGRDLAEVSGLAVHPDYQPSGVAILLRLIRMLVVYAAQVGSDLCIAVNPRQPAREDTFVIPWEQVTGKTFSLHGGRGRYAGRYAPFRNHWEVIANAGRRAGTLRRVA